MKHFSQNTLVDNKLKTYIMFVIFKTSNKDFVLNNFFMFFGESKLAALYIYMKKRKIKTHVTIKVAICMNKLTT